jgi:hypothetical protein
MFCLNKQFLFNDIFKDYNPSVLYKVIVSVSNFFFDRKASLTYLTLIL